MNPRTTADVVAAVDRAFTPDITIVIPKGFRWYRPDLCRDHWLFLQLKEEAGLDRVTPENVDRFIEAAGRHGMTVETIDEPHVKVARG